MRYRYSMAVFPDAFVHPGGDPPKEIGERLTAVGRNIGIGNPGGDAIRLFLLDVSKPAPCPAPVVAVSQRRSHSGVERKRPLSAALAAPD
jgi:hypothetical protein